MPVEIKPPEPPSFASRAAYSAGKKWYDETDPTDEIWATVRRLRTAQTWRRQSDELSLSLYSDMKYVGYRSRSGAGSMSDLLDARMGDNVIRSIIRTLDSKVGRHRPRVVVMTDGASWRQKHEAELAEKWIDGKLYECRAEDDLYPLWRLHAMVLGTGCLRSYGTVDKGAQLEVIPSYEIIVDDSEARYGNPRSIYFVRAVDRGVLNARYPGNEDTLAKASTGQHTSREWIDGIAAWDQEKSADLAIICEAIHLPSSASAGDGRWTVSVDSGVLADQEWKREHFPCAWLRRERRPGGFWGIGVPEDIAGAQLEINRSTLAVQEMIELLAVPYWAVERTAKVAKGHISNLVGRVLEFTGTAPALITPPSVPQELWNHRQERKGATFEAMGVSQLSAQMLKPAGLNSGRALRAYHEMEAELLVELIRGYENGVVRAAELLIEEQKELGDKVSSQAVSVIGRGGIEKIKWSQFKLDPTQYVLRAMPASALSTTVSGKIEDVFDLRDLGVLTDPEEIRDLIDLPDLKRQKRRAMSHRELLSKTIEWRMIERGQYVEPEPTWDLKLAIKLGLQHINELELYEDAPADRLDLLREFVESCRQLLAGAEEPPPAPETSNGIDPASAGLSGGIDPATGLPGSDPGAAPGGGPVFQ